MHIALDFIYALVGFLLLPLWLCKLPRGQRYRSGVLQRLGLVPRLDERPRVWIHCASVGEASIPKAVVERLRTESPCWDIVFSTNTDTGAQRLGELYPGSTVFYYPLDFSPCVSATLRRVKPCAVLLVELEVWPNFMRLCNRRGVPVCIVNGRIGQGSRRLWGRAQHILPWMWKSVRACCARSEDDARGFIAAGLPETLVHNCGSLKYDALSLEPDATRVAELRQAFGLADSAKVIVGGSTWAGEEAALAAAVRTLLADRQDLRLIIAPRHVERADSAEAEIRSTGLDVVRMTDIAGGRARPARQDVILVDSVGILTDCYGLADCAFVGRSLVDPGGGQNMMEPAGLGVPVVVGMHTGNFRPEMKLLRQAGGIIEVEDAGELQTALARILDDAGFANRVGAAGRSVVIAARGAVDRTMGHVGAVLKAACKGQSPT